MKKLWQTITKPFKAMADYAEFQKELDREVMKSQMKRDHWINNDNKVSGNTVTRPTEQFDSFTCKPESINQMLELYQGWKASRGFQKMKVDGIASMRSDKVTVIIRYYSPIT